MPTSSFAFETEIANLYRALGTRVRQDVSIAGNQIDIVVISSGSDGRDVTKIVECKAYRDPVGIEQIRAFSVVAGILRERNLAHLATIVSAAGFTSRARELANGLDIELLEVADLRRKVGSSSVTEVSSPSIPDEELAFLGIVEMPTQRRIFVAMPFTPQGDDVYLYGMQPAAEAEGYTIVRGDDNLDSGEIMEFVREQILGSDLIVVDTTDANPNVYYELGLADGAKRDVVLVARDDVQLPFDVHGRNHILYRNIQDLQNRLRDRLSKMRPPQ